MADINSVQDLDKFLGGPLQKKQPEQQRPFVGPPQAKQALPQVKSIQDLDSFLKTPATKYDMTPVQKYHETQGQVKAWEQEGKPKEQQLPEPTGPLEFVQWLNQKWRAGAERLADKWFAEPNVAGYQYRDELAHKARDPRLTPEQKAKAEQQVKDMDSLLRHGYEESEQQKDTLAHAAPHTARIVGRSFLLDLADWYSPIMMLLHGFGKVGEATAGMTGTAGRIARPAFAIANTAVGGNFSYDQVSQGIQQIRQGDTKEGWATLGGGAAIGLMTMLGVASAYPQIKEAELKEQTVNRLEALKRTLEKSPTMAKAQDLGLDFQLPSGLTPDVVQQAIDSINEKRDARTEAAGRRADGTIAARADRQPYRPVTGGAELPENDSMYMTPGERSQRYYTLEEARKRLDEERRVVTQEQEARTAAESESQRIQRERREQFEGEKAYREAREGKRLVVNERRGIEFDTLTADANREEHTRLTSELNRIAEEHTYTDVDEMMRSLDTEKGRGRPLDEWKKNVLDLEAKRRELLRLSDPTKLEPRRTEVFQGLAEDVKLAKREVDMREVAAKIDSEARNQTDADEFERMTAEADEARQRAEEIRTERDKKESERVAATADREQYPMGAVMSGMIEGNGRNIILPDGRKIAFHYAVVPVDQPVSSHDPFNNFEENPDAIKISQGRDYKNNKESQAATIARGKNPEMELLVNTAPTAETGPPIVRRDGQGIGGRNRINIWKLLYRNGFGESAHEALVSRAGEFGVPADKISEIYKAGKQPMLVRVLDEDIISAKDLAQLGRDLDRTQTMGFSEAEEAVAAGRALSDKSLEWISSRLDGMGEDASLRDLMRQYPSEIVERMLESDMISPTQRAASVNSLGEMTEKAKDLFEAAVLGKIIDDADLLSTTPREVLRKLERSVAALARVKAAGGLWDFTPEMEDALRLWKRVDSIRENLSEIGTKEDSLVDKYLNPGKYKMGTELMDFGGGTVRETPHPTVEALAKLLEKPAKEIKFAIGDYADDSEGKQATLMGNAPTPVESFNRNIAMKVGVDVPDDAWGVLRPLQKAEAEKPETRKEAVSGPIKEEEAPKAQPVQETPQEPTGIAVPPPLSGGVTVSGLEGVLTQNKNIAPVAKPLIEAMSTVVKNALKMELGDFLKKYWADIRTEGTPGESGMDQAAGSTAGWARAAGKKLTIVPYGEQLDLFGGAEPQFMLRDERPGVATANKERLVLKSELLKLRDEVPRLASMVDPDGNLVQSQLFGAEAENLFGPGPDEEPPQGTLFQDEDDRKLAEVFARSKSVGGNEADWFSKAKAEIFPDKRELSNAEIAQVSARARQMRIAAEGPKVLFQEKQGPWLLKSEVVLKDAKLANTQSGSQWAAFLKNKGVKADEMKWIGLDDFLAGKPKVTRQEVLDFIRENQLQITEVAKGQKIYPAEFDWHEESPGIWRGGLRGYKSAFEVTKDARGQWHTYDLTDHVDIGVFSTGGEAIEAAERSEGFAERSEDTSKYSQYTLPGEKKNYTELLIKLPYDKTLAPYDDWLKTTKYDDGPFAREAYGRLQSGHGESRHAFRSGHFDEPNILAHVRFDERTDAAGNRILLVEEVQSDWHQKGKKVGYKTEGADVNESERLAAWGRFKDLLRKDDFGGWESPGEAANDVRRILNGEAGNEYSPETLEAGREYIRLADIKARQIEGVPDAPFKTDWHELVMKRMLREAAERGFDKIAWVTGEQTADRYNLAKQIDTIYYTKRPDGDYEIDAVKDSQKVFTRKLKESELEESVGKDVAKRIVDGVGEVRQSRVRVGIDGKEVIESQRKMLSGIDLEVGGEWAKALYDRAIPNFMSKYGKKWGASVRDLDLPISAYFERVGNRYEVREGDLDENDERIYYLWDRWNNEPANVHETITEREFAEEIAADRNREAEEEMERKAKQSSAVHSMDISPEIKKSVMEGQPLFQTKKGATEFLNDGKAVVYLFQNADASTFLHEFFHTMRRYVEPQDRKVLEDWLKIKDGIWSRKDEEAAARAWEEYHHQRPSKSLPEKVAAVFAKIQQVMRKIYEQLKDLKSAAGPNYVKPSKEVSALFDRWYGKEMEAPPGGEPEPQIAKPEKKAETTARAKEMVNLHSQIKAIPQDIDDLQGTVDTIDRFIAKAEAGKLDENDHDAMMRDQYFTEAEVPEEEWKALQADKGAWKEYMPGWAGAKPGDVYPTKLTPTELQVLKEHAQALREDIEGLQQAVPILQKQLADLKAKGALPQDIADRHKLTTAGDLVPQGPPPDKAMQPPPGESAGQIEPPPGDETKATIQEMEGEIRDGKNNATLVGWAPDEDRNSDAAMKYAREQLEAEGWKYNAKEKQFEKDGWYAFLRSQGELAPPILQWARLEEPEPEGPKTRVVDVDAKRMAEGEYDVKTSKKVGQGDLSKSYSGHLISSGKIASIVTIEGKKYVTTGMWFGGGRGPAEFNMARVYTKAEWGDKPTRTYSEAIARRDETGGTLSYEGVKVKKGKEEYVLGPESEKITARAKVDRGELPPPPKPSENIEPSAQLETQALTPEERKDLTLKAQGGILPLDTGSVRSKVFPEIQKATEWAKANKDKIKGLQIFQLKDGRAVADFVAKKANVLFQSDYEREREIAFANVKIGMLQDKLKHVMSDVQRVEINKQIRDLRSKREAVKAVSMEPPPGEVVKLWTPEGEREVEVKREQKPESRPTRTIPDEAIRLSEPPRLGKPAEQPRTSGVSQPKPATGGGVRTSGAGKVGREGSGEPRTTLRDVKPLAVARVRSRGEAAYSESDWKNRVERYRLPENAPAPTRQISDGLGRMLMPGQREVVESVVSGLDQHDGYVLATTTGTGKTYMGSAVVADLVSRKPDARVLILTPSQSLIHGRDGWIMVGGNFGLDIEPVEAEGVSEAPGVFIKTWAGAILKDDIAKAPWDLVIMDEVQEARKWWSSQRGQMSKMMSDNAKKILYTSATPFHTALEIGHMGKLGLWGGEGFEHWATVNGLGVYRNKAGELAGGNAPLRLEKLRQQLIERGQMINIDRNMDGYSAHFGVVPMDGVTAQGLANIDKALQLAENYYARTSGKKGLVQAVKAQRTTLAKRWLEYQRLPQAIELAKKLEKEGWKAIFFSENKKEFTELFDFLKEADEATGGQISAIMPKFRGTTDVLREAFGDDIAVFAGKHSSEREGEKDDFNDDEKKHLYATYGAGGVGVSLHDKAGDKPRAVIYMGPPWSGISFDQALGRPWRYGTKSNVRAYFLFSDSQAEMDLVTTKVAPRMESLRAMVSGVNFEDPVVKNLRAVPDTQVAALDYDHGNAADADFGKFTSKRDTSGVTSYADLPIVSAEEAKNKGMRLPGSDGAQDPSIERLWQDSVDEDVLPQEFEAPELTLGRQVNVELAERFIQTGAAPGRDFRKEIDPVDRRALADAIMARAESAASQNPASAVQQVYTEWENAMKQSDAILSGEGGGEGMEPPPGVAPPGEGIPGQGQAPKPEKVGGWTAKKWYYFTNGRDVIRGAAKKAGVPEIGEKIARSIAQYHVEAGNISGPWTTRYWDIIKGMTQDEHRVFALTLANREKASKSIDRQLAEMRSKAPMSPKIEKAVKETQQLFKEVFRRMQDDNIYLTVWDSQTGKSRNVYYNEFGSGEGYFPRKYDYDTDHRVKDPETGVETVFNLRNLTRGEMNEGKREKIIRGMMDRYGLNRAEVEDFLQARKRDVPLAGHVERARDADMPFFRTDPEVVISYLEGAGELLSRKKYFAQDGSKVKGLIAQIPDQKARNITGDIVESLLKRNPMEEETRAFLRFAADWSVMKMTFSAIKVLGHPAHGALMTNLRSFFKALYEGTAGYSEAARRAQLAGSTQEQTKVEMLSEFGINKRGLSSTLLKWNGWQSTYKWGRVVADSMARIYMTDYALNDLMKDPGNERVRRGLREFMQLDDAKIDAAVRRRRWTDEDLQWAGKAFSDKTMYTFDPTELPPTWRARAGQEHPYTDDLLTTVRTLTLLKGYQFKTHALLKDAIWDEAMKGNLRPLIPFLALYPAGGFLLHSLTSLATANWKYFQNLMKDKSWTPGRTLWRMVDEIAHMIGDTALTAALDAAAHGKETTAGAVASDYVSGAVVSDIMRTAALPVQLEHAKSNRTRGKIARRYVEGTIPATRTVLNLLEPPPAAANPTEKVLPPAP